MSDAWWHIIDVIYDCFSKVRRLLFKMLIKANMIGLGNEMFSDK